MVFGPRDLWINKKPRLDSIQDKAKEQQARSEAKRRKLFQAEVDVVNYLVVSFFYYFHPYLGEWSNWTNIFLDGLKPPTSKDMPVNHCFLNRYISIYHVLPRLYMCKCMYIYIYICILYVKKHVNISKIHTQTLWIWYFRSKSLFANSARPPLRLRDACRHLRPSCSTSKNRRWEVENFILWSRQDGVSPKKMVVKSKGIPKKSPRTFRFPGFI